MADVHLGAIRLWDPKTSWAAATCIPLWTKEKGAGAWYFKSKASNSHVDEREQVCKLSLGHPEKMGPRGKFNQQAGLGDAPSFKQVFLPKFL